MVMIVDAIVKVTSATPYKRSGKSLVRLTVKENSPDSLDGADIVINANQFKMDDPAKSNPAVLVGKFLRFKLEGIDIPLNVGRAVAGSARK